MHNDDPENKEFVKRTMATIGLRQVPLPYKNLDNVKPVTIVSVNDSIDRVLERISWGEGEYTNLIVSNVHYFEVIQQPVSYNLVRKFQKSCDSELHSSYWLKVWFEENLTFPEAKRYDYWEQKPRKSNKNS